MVSIHIDGELDQLAASPSRAGSRGLGLRVIDKNTPTRLPGPNGSKTPKQLALRTLALDSDPIESENENNGDALSSKDAAELKRAQNDIPSWMRLDIDSLIAPAQFVPPSVEPPEVELPEVEAAAPSAEAEPEACVPETEDEFKPADEFAMQLDAAEAEEADEAEKVSIGVAHGEPDASSPVAEEAEAFEELTEESPTEVGDAELLAAEQQASPLAHVAEAGVAEAGVAEASVAEAGVAEADEDDAQCEDADEEGIGRDEVISELYQTVQALEEDRSAMGEKIETLTNVRSSSHATGRRR